jgi:ABC-2 type transport system permease protein
MGTEARPTDFETSPPGLLGLLSLYYKTARHYFTPFRWKNYLPIFSLAILGASLLALEFYGFKKVFRYMRSLEDFSPFFVQFLLERLFGLIFLISFTMLFMSSIINGLSCFFLSKKLPFLFSLPLPRKKILSVQFLENWGTSSYLIVMFLFSFLLAYASSFDVSWQQYGSFVLLLLLFTLSPVAMGSAAVVMLIRFFPVRRIHQLVTLIACVFLGALMISVRMMKPERLLNPSTTDDFVRLVQDLTVPSMSYLPSAWTSKAAVQGQFEPVLYLLLFTVVTLFLLVAAMLAFYQKAFIFSQESRSLRGKPFAKRSSSKSPGHPVAALMRKDLRLFLRDATQWSQLLLLAALVIVYLLNIKNLAIQLPMVRWIVSFINLGLAGFVLAALSVRFLFPSVSMEGRSFWIVRTLPISFRSLLWCKYLIFFPPFLLFSQMLVYFSNRILKVPEFFLLLSMANVFAISFALTGLAIGIGALLPNFKSDNPSQIAVGPGGVLYMLLSFIYLTLMFGLQVRPVWYYVIRHSDEINNSLYALAAIVLTLAVGLIPLEWGARRLARSEYL